MSHVVCHMLYVTCCMSHVVCDMLYVVCCMLYHVSCMLYVVSCILYVVCCVCCVYSMLYMVCLLCISLLSINSIRIMKHRYYRLIDEVKKRVATGQLKDAIKLYENNPDPFTATFLIGHAHKELKDLSLALGIYHVLRTSPTTKPDSFVFSSLVFACQKLGQPSHITSLWSDIIHQK
jgi:hypothetical protein